MLAMLCQMITNDRDLQINNIWIGDWTPNTTHIHISSCDGKN